MTVVGFWVRKIYGEFMENQFNKSEEQYEAGEHTISENKGKKSPKNTKKKAKTIKIQKTEDIT